MSNLNYQSEDRTRKKFDSLTGGMSLLGKRILDVGCNTGLMSYMAFYAGYQTASVVGIDVDAEAIALANGITEVCLAKEPGSRRLTFQATQFQDFKDPDGFDVVIATSVIHHLGPFDETIERLAALVRSDGVLTCDIWCTNFASPAEYESQWGKTHRLPTWMHVVQTLRKHFKREEDHGDASDQTRPGTRRVRAYR